MNKQRPVNLDLFTIKFPIAAIISILHRVSGTILFLLIPFLLWMLYASLGSPMTFDALQDFLSSLWIRFFIWLILVALMYHLVAGVRHLLMDMGIGESLAAGRKSSYVVIAITIILALILGAWLW